MNRLLLLFIILVLFGGAASAAEISGSTVSDGKKQSGLAVTLSKINGTSQSDQSMTGVIYDFIKLSETTTDKNGSYAFNDLNSGMYRINVTYNGTVYGENTGLKDRAIVNFNLSGKIEGSVLKANKTLEGIPIRLLDAGGIEVMDTTTGKSGKYSFNKVNAGKSYLVEATYADVPYTKQVNASESADFTVYEPTKDDNIIAVKIDHIVLSKAPTGVKVDEYVEFTNIGDKVFFSKDRTWLGISTPQGISRFQTDVMECCLQREKDSAWIDPMRPIMPGESYSAQISYILSSDSSAPTLSKGMIYNTSYMSLLSDKNNGFGIESKYVKKEIVPNEGKEFEVLSFMNVPKGQIIDTQITGYVPSKTGIGGDFNYLIPVLAVVLIGAVSYPLLKNKIGRKQRRRSIRTPSVTRISEDEPQETAESALQPDVVQGNVPGKDINEMSFDELLTEKNATFESILALENKFNAGEITEKEYKEVKKEYKEKSVAVIKQLKEVALNLDLNQSVPDLEKIIAHVDDIDVLEELLEREKEGDNRDELKEIIEQRIEDIEQNE
ncbi:MAG: hypothetical protein OIN66_15810 [Candidatus Methanoperedens sp.]|nr:hypothetical protein [Candidatus Methanoperedens sp.]